MIYYSSFDQGCEDQWSDPPGEEFVLLKYTVTLAISSRSKREEGIESRCSSLLVRWTQNSPQNPQDIVKVWN